VRRGEGEGDGVLQGCGRRNGDPRKVCCESVFCDIEDAGCETAPSDVPAAEVLDLVCEDYGGGMAVETAVAPQLIYGECPTSIIQKKPISSDFSQSMRKIFRPTSGSRWPFCKKRVAKERETQS